MHIHIIQLVCFALMANAHTYLTNLTINGTLLDEGKCIRPPWENENFPVKDVTSKDLLCRTKSMTVASADICGIQAGSNITVDLHESGPGSRALSESHRGPCIVYMAPLDSNGDGPVWFKIYEDGWDKAADTWCVNTLIANKGKLEVTIPRDIAPGNYLLRTEVIALHEANRVYGADESAGAELFPNCAQLAVYGTGTVHPSGVNIPGIYDKTQPGLHYDLWGDSTTYEIPGPTLYVPGKGAPIVLAADIQSLDLSIGEDSELILDTHPSPTSDDVTQLSPSSKSNHCVGKKRRRRARIEM